MRKAAIIVENRNLPYLDRVIQNHMDHLPGFDLIHYSDMVVNSGHDYNNILTLPKFWDIDYDKVVIFQHDSGILRNGIEEFLDYDYVGSPWRASANWARYDRAGGNGGFSVRDVKAHRDLLRIKLYDPHVENEDVWFTRNLPNVAPYSVCVKFACETEYQLGTLGYHAIEKHMSTTEVNNILYQYE
tara:strand:+ start:399 stop:956 length:558 start_codon:yes stop_codon:yes gene_type:complete